MNSARNITAASITERLKAEWRLKLVLLFVLNLCIYAPYLFLQRHHFFPATTMPASYCDQLIPFSSQTVWIYLSIYLLMPIGPFLMDERRQVLRYAFGIVLIGLIADIIFLFCPTSCPRPDITATNAGYQALVSVDNSFHAFPSLHAAFAVYSAMCGGIILRELGKARFWQTGLWLWAFLILLATLTTKQHVISDVVAGGLLGFGVGRWVLNPWKSAIIKRSLSQPFSANPTQPNLL